MKKHEGFVASEVKEIESIINNIGDQVQEGIAADDYSRERIRLNIHIIQALLGAEYVSKNGKPGKLNFHHRAPKPEVLAEVSKLVEGFIANVENPYLEAAKAAAEGDDDMSIDGISVEHGAGVNDINKVNYKKLANEMFGDGRPAVNIALSPADCARIYALGKEARKRHTVKVTLVIGGVAIVIGGVLIYKDKKDKDSDGCPECSEAEEPAIEVAEVPVDDETDIDDSDDIDDIEDVA